MWLIVLVCAAFAQSAAAAKSSDRPRVKADASLIKGLIKTPLPNYPAIAAKQGWGGLGVFELQFQPDGTVRNVVTLLSTGHPLLDETARASLQQWRCQPRAQWSGRLTISFSTKQHPIQLEPGGDEVRKNFPVHPSPTYPLEARRRRWFGNGLFVMRFRPDGSVAQVVALKSTDHAVLDEEVVRTLRRWRCLPGVYVSAYIPVTFSMAR